MALGWNPRQCPDGGVCKGRTELVPAGWPPASLSQKGETNGSLLCLQFISCCSGSAVLLHTRVIIPTMRNTCESHYHRHLRRGGGRGPGLRFWLLRYWRADQAPRPHFPAASVITALIGRFVPNTSVAITLPVTSKSAVPLLGK